MDASSARQCVLTFLEAFYAGDAARVAQCCDDGFTTLTYAPVEIFPHLGLKHGKEWIAESIRIQEERFSSRHHTLRFVAVEGLRVATLSDVSLVKRNDQRVVKLTVGEFFTLSGGRILEHRAFFDSLDLLQQLLGRDLTEAFAAGIRDAMTR
ncbi:nuclear transport factor 2 family protein [Bradyrhizobium sp. U87765 SZCCT0131]|uniref:nuclear transport factor 2 family protein n=1 Tax=unclassified Bradyrhizobium TaxID=2631580 RepID=UPI001BA86C44|nr:MULTISPECIES: nuclear transport factor 2 family protein [unclassified Bradyrhizobium]MBR1221905.1 nuclear transport factor 2 family protein [Bradyrhizobium sp. U87765 SZCCT0131]MBR1263897.1 nuclear transport factor 2 family protein [Bradyrhizobium sp. U87765 SZCCT0134]MBR1302533.1 nuclear transport factor 2 family protein [Bradyrhizobium sp. U87765 SZCCT0110]MBR1320147.1 nuclear transport factor 2 family protein [Bradyrhizobium sp. U87765 SZCCT0109]MBR1348740.1 nuclear transport factor 2 fa